MEMMETPDLGKPGPNELPTVAVVQARLGSVRFPRKVLSGLGGVPALKFLLSRLSRSSTIQGIVVAIPDGSSDDELAEALTHWGYSIFRGSEGDVLDRFWKAASSVNAGVVIRITGDCPFVDPHLVDTVVEQFIASSADYARTSESYPDGFDVEVFRKSSLDEAYSKAVDAYDREHVTPWIRRNAAVSVDLPFSEDLSSGRVTLDEKEDLEVLRLIVDHFGNNQFTVDDVTDLMRSHAVLFEANRHLVRNEGATMATGEKLWRRAREVIPGGNMLLSKRAEQFLPNGWPTYFSKAKGCEVWDLDGRKYFDLSLMGVGTNILGYGHPKVDEAVRKVVDAGNLSTLNCPEEVELAERLCALHPWADMAKFARSGGEACAIAIRIARAASGKPAVAICGYHGWHDWYLSANLADDAALDGHLLPGLTPAGVPRQLQGLTRPFFYNDLDALKTILSAGDVGVVIMEVERSTPPAPGFLEGVRELTRANGCVLIFDECTSGFRRNLGGLHLHYGVEPDVATFGKTLGNGYAITSVIGRREIMESAESTFISSTFWTERIGPTAALATLDAMEQEGAPARVHQIGKEIRNLWSRVASSVGIEVMPSGIPALNSFSVSGWNPAVMKRELISRMLRRGFLAGPAVYASVAHTPTILEQYESALNDSLVEITELPSELIIGDSVSSGSGGFGRLA